MKYSLPVDIAPLSYNPPMWDRVIDNGRLVAAIAFTKSGKEKMFQMGWSDAVDGKNPKASNDFYLDGWFQGVQDLFEVQLI